MLSVKPNPPAGAGACGNGRLMWIGIYARLEFSGSIFPFLDKNEGSRRLWGSRRLFLTLDELVPSYRSALAPLVSHL
jgi:hypothetical protein